MDKPTQSPLASQPANILLINALSPFTKGIITMILVLLIWSGFSLTVRFIGASPLMIADVALIRFAVPVIVLFPLLFSRFNEIKKVKINDILVILLGGIPFLFLASLGAKTAPTAYVGTILVGTPPFFVALLSYILYRRTLPLKQMFTLSLILVGVLTMVVGLENEVSQDVLKGIGFLLSASVIWATYTIGLKRAGISAITVAIILSYSSFFIMLALMFCGVVSSNWGEFSVQQALPFILIQGLGVGILATIGFSYAVAQLGSARSSVIGALSPGITALLALPIFDEPLSIAIICGITITITGVILSNR